MKEKVVIVGGGIAGLTAAYLLKMKGVDALVLEASSRLGGRILTKKVNALSLELGATWVFQDETLKELINELGLQIYPQFLSGNALVKYSPTMAIQQESTERLMNGTIYHKVEGGTSRIIEVLENKIGKANIKLDAKVKALNFREDDVVITLSDGHEFLTDKVILALPPKSINEEVEFLPDLGAKNLLESTHTWMGESSKFSVAMDDDYWRKKGLSGFIYSNYGLIREAQDHSSSDGSTFGLVGFLSVDDELKEDFEKRKQLVIAELNDLLGIQGENILAYDDCLWGKSFTTKNGDNYNQDLMAHQFNGHSFYLKSYYDNRLLFIGAETSSTHPGYMEGAVRSARRVLGFIL